jgi:1-pyrroline-5-carboxylate dehydrogenase
MLTAVYDACESFSGWKGSGVTGKGGFGEWYVAQFMREQSRTVRPNSMTQPGN